MSLSMEQQPTLLCCGTLFVDVGRLTEMPPKRAEAWVFARITISRFAPSASYYHSGPFAHRHFAWLAKSGVMQLRPRWAVLCREARGQEDEEQEQDAAAAAAEEEEQEEEEEDDDEDDDGEEEERAEEAALALRRHLDARL
ncbi:uncharacterized protein MAM_06231 [Metarhizium album ARSEF 1941]|uniref:Uncharacterized protein n=1 Tax=Metarhizium album (strain ARSEF 1941) TaxID=1081103 RepID=A0A0B2WQF1_METAS|nr:uncharacterized protein MAM_06231 [Metarhizium album ARSEF 1941]KHN95869.1 hypothetical protein MAM_06231 [Metarhizium album ARSEF 1941]